MNHDDRAARAFEAVAEIATVPISYASNAFAGDEIADPILLAVRVCGVLFLDGAISRAEAEQLRDVWQAAYNAAESEVPE